ncbi:MAG: type III restriction-modification system endonuclease [Lactococcus cremoris]
MKLHLLELPHQLEALNDILKAFPELDIFAKKDENGLAANSIYANPILKTAFQENKFIDVKMETGTGKTYTYTRMMYELHEKLGLFKFVIVVPSLAIKEGSKSFLTAESTTYHFRQELPQFSRIDLHLGVVNSGDFSAGKGKRKEIPNIIREFAEADSNNKNQINVLLLSDKGFLDKATSSLFKDDYDMNLFGGESSPAAMIAKTRPVVIIDEPHRIKRDGKSYKHIIDKLKPEMIVRFGATFPSIIQGRGKNKVTKTDFYRGEPQHNLTSVDAFNQDLVKGVRVEIPEGANKSDAYRIKAATSKELVLTRQGKDYRIANGESLDSIDDRFPAYITYQSKVLSNNEDFELPVDMRLVPDSFANSYQEILIDQALEAHFETERENFVREGFKVKTNALFFIESRKSYREETWLTETFDKLLKDKITLLIAKESNSEYKSFLTATLNDLPGSRGGYFSGDSNHKSSDDKITEETNVILRDKSKSLGFKDKDGKWNTLRFFFSQWALREGWDNPNVFTIAKLRSSGSESSKIQEVGRGLRLPVDEMGNRISDEDWFLNFIVDESEREFAQSLTTEINGEAQEKILENVNISSEIIKKLRDEDYGENKRQIINKLYDAKIIDDNDLVINVSALQALLPQSGLKKGKVKVGRDNAVDMVKLNKENWNNIKDFWLEVSQRYMLQFNEIENLSELFKQAISDETIFNNNDTLSVTVEQTQKSENQISIVGNSTYIRNRHNIGRLPYGMFVRQLNRTTNLEIKLIHEALSERLSEFDKSIVNDVLNEKTLSKILNSWQTVFENNFSEKYHYNKLEFKAKTSVWKNQDFLDEIPQGIVGTIPVDVISDKRNLFKEIFVDSENPEAKIAKFKPDDKIKVFGKIPRRAIQVPTYTGGTSTPDFVYATNDNLFLLIEAKAGGGLRRSEEIAVESQGKAFKNLENVKWSKVTSKDEVVDLLNNLKKIKK